MAYSDTQQIALNGIYGPPVLDTTLPTVIKGVWCTTAGNIAYVGAGQSDTLILTGVPASQWIPTYWKRINTASTTAVIGTVIYDRKGSQNVGV